MNWFFAFFFISGFCSVLYELVWLRLSMAQFGVTTAMVSIVLSVFMAGLGLGSWVSGRWLLRPSRESFSALRLYALIEFLIGVSGIVVPYGLLWGRHTLERFSLSSSFSYYLATGLWVAVMLIPWCTLMGATVPVGMRAIRQLHPSESNRSFSYLYMANVGGAIAGTAIPLLLIELVGFRGTLRIGAVCNLFIAVIALLRSRQPIQAPATTHSAAASTPALAESGSTRILALLFLSGLSSMAMEVIWVRRFTPYVGTVVYAFASILAVYLFSTFVGSYVYRRWSSHTAEEHPAIWIILAACALLPLVAGGPLIHLTNLKRLFLGIGPFTALLGFITPMLVDRYSHGDSAKAGRAYAVNISGCIVGPILAGFGLLPFLSERAALILLTIPWLLVGFEPLRPGARPARGVRAAVFASLALAAVVIVLGRGYDENSGGRRILRDSTATVIATGTGMDKQLLVNGYGMTSLTTITKVMAHLPLASLDHPPQNALVICFGMGTTFRALRSWGIPVTAAELVPSVPKLIGYYHDDGNQVVASPLSHVEIDDGRRFLERTTDQFDLITIDPPPPLPAAGSSLLYSKEFYEVARRRLRPGGILQQWLPTVPDSEPVDVTSVTLSLQAEFPYIRAFEDEFGIHYLCSDRPIPVRTVDELVQRMPPAALKDFAEWEMPNDPVASARYVFGNLLRQELKPEALAAASPDTPALTDDRPITEYYVLRRWRHQSYAEVD